jgi:hypothetical protein
VSERFAQRVRNLAARPERPFERAARRLVLCLNRVRLGVREPAGARQGGAQIDGAAAGTNTATYTVTPADVGKTATCVVTATNAVGSTAAPASNPVIIADPAGATRNRR